MATPGYAQLAVRIDVHINHADAASGRTGTFLGPAPLVRVKAGDTVEWRITPPSDQFQVIFPAVSPFNGAPNPITNGTGVLTAENIGNYHYQISVSDGTDTWVISNCPELNVGN